MIIKQNLKCSSVLNIPKGEKMKKIFFIMLSVLLIMSCGGNGSKTAFENYMNAMKSGDPAKIDKLNEEWDNGVEKIQGNENFTYLLEMFKKTEYKVLEVKEEKDKSEIKVELKTPDLFSYAEEVFGGLKATENHDEMKKQINERFKYVLNKKSLKYNEKTVTVIMTKKDGKWILDQSNEQNKEFGSLMIGGLDNFKQVFLEKLIFKIFN